MNSFYILVYFFYLLKDTSGLTEDQLKCVGENQAKVIRAIARARPTSKGRKGRSPKQ